MSYVDDEHVANIFWSGCIAGPDGCLVKLSDAIKKPWPKVTIDPLLLQPATKTTSRTA